MIEPIHIDPKTFLRQHFALPALPEVVARLQATIYDDDIDIDDVAQLISGDPALVAQVLKIVNSAYYGLSKDISKVRVAIALIGLNEIFNMILSLSVINTLGIHENEGLNKYWFHSFYVAHCTKYLARKFDPHLPYEELWSAAMLHDIGKLVYLKFFPDHFMELNRFCEKNGCLFPEAERHFSLPTSASLGLLLCDHWRLPEKVKLACEFHTLENLQSIDENHPSASFIHIICAGNLLTVLAMENLNDDIKRDIADVIAGRLHCSKENFLAIMGDIYELKSDVEEFISKIRQ